MSNQKGAEPTVSTVAEVDASRATLLRMALINDGDLPVLDSALRTLNSFTFRGNPRKQFLKLLFDRYEQ